MDVCHATSGTLPSLGNSHGVHSRRLSLHRKSHSVPCADVASYSCSSQEDLDPPALAGSGGLPVVVLKLYKTPAHTGYLPIFHEGEDISGNVELHLSKSKSLEEITLSVRGTVNSLTKHQRIFVAVTEKLWEASQVEQDACQKSHTGSVSAKLKGRFNWPFSLKLPNHISALDAQAYNCSGPEFIGQLPPSFTTANARSSITYEVIVTLRGRIGNTLSSPFIYIPTIRRPHLPFPGGLACNRALQEDFWHVFKPFNIRGIAFSAYDVDVSCIFALAKPLHYTRGSSIFCVLALESADMNVLGLLASAGAPCVQLSAQVTDLSSGLEAKIARILDHTKQPDVLVSSATWYSTDNGYEQSEEMLAGVRAVKSHLKEGVHSKLLVGEIPLARDLTPTFTFAKISLEYEIQMLSFKAAGFNHEDGDKTVFFRTRILIASAPPIPLASRPKRAASSSSSSLPRTPCSARRQQQSVRLAEASQPPSRQLQCYDAPPRSRSPSSCHVHSTDPHPESDLDADVGLKLDKPLPRLPCSILQEQEQEQERKDVSRCIRKPERTTNSLARLDLSSKPGLRSRYVGSTPVLRRSVTETGAVSPLPPYPGPALPPRQYTR